MSCSFICVRLIISINVPKKERSSVQSLLLFFFKSFVAVAVTHNAVNGLETVSSGDVKLSLLNERMLVAL